MQRAAITISLIFTILINNMLFAQERRKNADSATDTTDIHYTGKYCTECHEKTPEEGGHKFLKFSGDFTQLCKCHGYTTGTYIHPENVAPSEEIKAKMPDTMPLIDGRLSCVTCHDIYLQCQKSKRLKRLNRKFLRGAPYGRRTGICFRCHDEKKYKMLDPHNQLNANGDIIVEKCLYCHVEKPDERRATYKDVKLIGSLDMLCQRCHAERKHPASANHLREPSAETLAIMKEGEKKFSIVLPLDAKGKVTCATCHNPHEKGVIPHGAGAKGASEKFRHRLPDKMCMACHKK